MPPAEWVQIRRVGAAEPVVPANSGYLQAIVQLIELALVSNGDSTLLDRALERMGSVVAADRVEMLGGAPHWQSLDVWPKQVRSGQDWPTGLFREALDRGAATAVAASGTRPSTLLAALDSRLLPNRLLAASRSRPFGRNDAECWAALAPVLSCLLSSGQA